MFSVPNIARSEDEGGSLLWYFGKALHAVVGPSQFEHERALVVPGLSVPRLVLWLVNLGWLNLWLSRKFSFFSLLELSVAHGSLMWRTG